MSKLGEWVLDCASGPFGSNLKVECFVDKGFPIIDGANMRGVRVTDNVTKFVTEEKARSLSRSIAKRHDVVVTISGTLGQVAFIPLDSQYEEYLCSQRQFRVTFDETKVDVEYLVYYLHTNEGQKKILSFANYVGVPALSQPLPNFKNIEVAFPDVEEQHRRIRIIKELDEKISNNNDVTALLEQQAKLLYDYWFVQFDFPDENGKPYKSSGGKMVWNEEVKREIPEGWKVMKFDDIVDDPPKLKAIKAPDYKDKGKYPIVDQADKLITGYTDDESYLYNNDECVVFGDVTTYFKYINFPFAKGTDGTKIIKSKENRIPALLLYHLVKDSKLPNVGFARHYMFLREVKILVPDKQVCRQYDHLTKNMMNKRRECIEENQQLSSLRDFLLPMLMNGQVKVG